MGVLTDPVARGDMLLRRGITNEWAVKWEQSTDGVTYQPVSMAGWSATAELLSLTGEVWLSITAFPSSNGVTVARIGPTVLTSEAWRGRTQGAWRMTATNGTRVERLGDGYFYLED